MDEEAAITRRWGKWAQPGVPHKGWMCLSEYDAVEENGEGGLITCDMCESTQVRFVHVMIHPEWPDQLDCGCVCSAHMSEDRAAADDRERRMRSRSSRREHFAKRKGWRTSRTNDTPFLRIDGYHLMIARKADGSFQVGAKGPTELGHRWGKKRFATIDEAKTGCFDALEFLRGEHCNGA
jgi:hypothetical protein